MKKFTTIAISIVMIVSTAATAFAATKNETKTAVTVSIANSAEIDADVVANEIQSKDGVLITKIKETNKNNNKATMYSGVMNKQEFEKVLYKIGKTKKETEAALKQYDKYYEMQNNMTIKIKDEEISNTITTTEKNDTPKLSTTYKFDDKNYEKFNEILTNEFINTALEMGYLTESFVEFNIKTTEAE